MHKPLIVLKSKRNQGKKPNPEKCENCNFQKSQNLKNENCRCNIRHNNTYLTTKEVI